MDVKSKGMRRAKKWSPTFSLGQEKHMNKICNAKLLRMKAERSDRSRVACVHADPIGDIPKSEHI